jgi:hypothetical protein
MPVQRSDVTKIVDLVTSSVTTGAGGWSHALSRRDLPDAFLAAPSAIGHSAGSLQAVFRQPLLPGCQHVRRRPFWAADCHLVAANLAANDGQTIKAATSTAHDPPSRKSPGSAAGPATIPPWPAPSSGWRAWPPTLVTGTSSHAARRHAGHARQDRNSVAILRNALSPPGKRRPDKPGPRRRAATAGLHPRHGTQLRPGHRPRPQGNPASHVTAELQVGADIASTSLRTWLAHI